MVLFVQNIKIYRNESDKDVSQDQNILHIYKMFVRWRGKKSLCRLSLNSKVLRFWLNLIS